jgi:hypothetical protein
MTNEPRHVGFSFQSITTNCNKAFIGNRITFINKGTGSARISDNFQLDPGQSFTLHSWPGEVITTVFNITFLTPLVNGNLLIVLVKNYLS